jgi:HTH-type transcriptional regulator/antitoxin HigA
MRTSTQARPVHPTYLKLVRECPLRTIRTDEELDVALAVARRLMELGDDLDTGGEEYLDALAYFIEKYEQEKGPMGGPSEADILRLLLDSSGLTQSAFAVEVGIAQPTLSAVLNGRRALAKEHIAALSKRFLVSPALFFDTKSSGEDPTAKPQSKTARTARRKPTVDPVSGRQSSTHADD